jgi:uroporphyrinogen decarboxylase
MDQRENLVSLLRRRGFGEFPVQFSLCPALEKQFREKTGAESGYEDYFGFSERGVSGLRPPERDGRIFLPYYRKPLKPGAQIDLWGVAHEPGSAAAMHMTYMRHPLNDVDSVEEIEAYPYPDYAHADASHMKAEVDRLHERGLAATGYMQCTVWETAWYLRGMENLMMDMMEDDPKAERLLDIVTGSAVLRAEAFARAGVDLLYLGDDVGMQRTPMMSMSLYTTWLKPRLARVIGAARAVKPDIVILYHSCGFVTPFIPHLIDAGVDVLNPVQPECMDFGKIHAEFGDVLSFHGTIGTQTTMPFGTPDEVKNTVWKNAEIAGNRGGLWASPTHLLEPEVPWENVVAYVEACRALTN